MLRWMCRRSTCDAFPRCPSRDRRCRTRRSVPLCRGRRQRQRLLSHPLRRHRRPHRFHLRTRQHRRRHWRRRHRRSRRHLPCRNPLLRCTPVREARNSRAATAPRNASHRQLTTHSTTPLDGCVSGASHSESPHHTDVIVAPIPRFVVDDPRCINPTSQPHSMRRGPQRGACS